MSDKFFLDTNILIYAFSSQDEAKRHRAMTLLRKAIQTGLGIISWQVVQEFLSVALHKNTLNSMTADELDNTVKLILAPLCLVWPSAELWQAALQLQQQTSYRYYDSLVLAAALASGAHILYSEDLQHGRKIGPLRIENPFLA